MTIPSCDISAANSGGDNSRAVLTDLTIADVWFSNALNPSSF